MLGGATGRKTLRPHRLVTCCLGTAHRTRSSPGSAAGDRIRGDIGGDGEDWGEGEDEDEDKDRLCTRFWHSSRRYWYNRFFDENTFS